MNVGELSVGVRADIRELTVGLQRGITEIKQFQVQTQGYIRAHAEEWASMGRKVALALAGVSWAINRMAQDAARYGEEILRASKATGMTVEEIQRLRYAVEQEEGNFNAVTETIFRLTLASNKAIDGNKEMIKTFDQLGVKFQDVNGNIRSGTDMMMDLSDAYVNGKLSGGDLAATLELIGMRGAMNVLPFLSVGRTRIQELFKESEKYGNLTKEQIRSLDMWGDSLQRMQKSTMLFKTTLVDAFLPILPQVERNILRLAQGWKGFEIVVMQSTKGITLLAEGFSVLGGLAARILPGDRFLGISKEAWEAGRASLEKAREDLNKDIRESGVVIRNLQKQINEIRDFSVEDLAGEKNPIARALDEQTEEIRKSKEDLISEMLGVFEWKPVAMLAGAGAEFGMKGGEIAGEKGSTVLNLSIMVQSRSDLHRQLDAELDKLGTVN